ncbi:MAG: hypothetical protein SF028_07215 [Candidatus Sumerlaeia bacterium]|nr:hypothetical protein [Candidatus Sumerlaeia bacterium]
MATIPAGAAAGFDIPAALRAFAAALLATAFAAAALLLAVGMPLFSPVDEIQHVDYALKLARHGEASPLEPVERDLWEIARSHGFRANQYYFGRGWWLPREPSALSGIAYHRPAFHRATGEALDWALRRGLFALEEGILLLRLACAAAFLAARLLLVFVLWRVHPLLGAASLAYAASFLPVEMLRFSNDTPVHVLSAAAMALFFGRGPGRAPGIPALIAGGLALGAAILIKPNAGLFALPGAALALTALCWTARPRRRLLAPLAGIAIPAAAVAFAVLRMGDMQEQISEVIRSNREHLAEPLRGSPLLLIPSFSRQYHLEMSFFTADTVFLSYKHHILPGAHELRTLTLLGAVFSLLALWRGPGGARLARLFPAAPGARGAFLWLLAAALAARLGITFVETWFDLYVGYFHLLTIRQLLPAELFLLLPVVAGWTLFTASPHRSAAWFRGALFVGFAAVGWGMTAVFAAVLR